MWTLVVFVLFVSGGQLHRQEMVSNASFESVEACMERGRTASAQFAEIPDVRGVGFVCAPAPVT